MRIYFYNEEDWSPEDERLHARYERDIVRPGYLVPYRDWYNERKGLAISAAISFLRTLVFQVFAVLVLPIVLDIDGIWYALVFAEAAALLVSAALLVKNRNRYHYA